MSNQDSNQNSFKEETLKDFQKRISKDLLDKIQQFENLNIKKRQ